MNKTKIKLIEAAEIEFAERGFHGASIRNITTRADTNIASINYHFGSKEELFIAMIRYRIEPINSKRFSLLEQALEDNGGKALSVRHLIEILVRPMTEAMSKGKNRTAFVRALGRGMSEENRFSDALYKDVLLELIMTFRKELARTLEGFSPELVDHCFAHIGSSISGVMQHRQRKAPGQNRIKFPDTDLMITFIAGGIEAIVAEREQTNRD